MLMLVEAALKFTYMKNNKHIIQSFQLGAVRGMLCKDDPEEWLRLKKWLSKQSKTYNSCWVRWEYSFIFKP